jgi:hypothetical protein
MPLSKSSFKVRRKWCCTKERWPRPSELGSLSVDTNWHYGCAEALIIIQILPRMRVIGTAEPPPLGVKAASIWRPYGDLCEALSQSRTPFPLLQLAE